MGWVVPVILCGIAVLAITFIAGIALLFLGAMAGIEDEFDD